MFDVSMPPKPQLAEWWSRSAKAGPARVKRQGQLDLTSCSEKEHARWQNSMRVCVLLTTLAKEREVNSVMITMMKTLVIEMMKSNSDEEKPESLHDRKPDHENANTSHFI